MNYVVEQIPMVVTIFKTASAVLDSTLCCFKKLSTVLPAFSPLQVQSKVNPYEQTITNEMQPVLQRLSETS